MAQLGNDNRRSALGRRLIFMDISSRWQVGFLGIKGGKCVGIILDRDLNA